MILASFAGAFAQHAEISPGDKLIVEGIPPIPASLAKSVAPYRDSYSDSLLGWDPVKPEIAIIRRTTQGWPIARVAASGGSAKAFAVVPAGCYDTLYQPQGKFLIFKIDSTGGAELTQLYAYDIGTGAKTLLTDGTSRNLYPIWSNSGEWLMYSSTRRNGKDLDIYAVKPPDPKSDHLVAQMSGEDWAVFDWSLDDRRVILSDYRSNSESYLWILDVASGQKTQLTPSRKGEKVFNGSYAQFSKDGKGVYHITDRDSEFQRLAYVDTATGHYTYVTKDVRWDVENFVMSRDRSLLAYITNEEGISHLHFLDTQAKRELPLPKLPPGIVSDLSWHNDGKHLGFVVSSTNSPGAVYSVEVATGKVDQWTKSRAGALPAEGWREPEIIKWKSFDGRMIPGFLYRPPSKFGGKRPVVIDIHGGPWLQYRPGFRGRDNYFTSELGVAMIYPNIRGSTGYGKNYLKLDNGLLRENSYKDISALLDWIKTQPDLDPERVLLRGASGGANIALASAANESGRIRGTISVSGASSLLTFLRGVDRWVQDRFREEYGDERQDRMRHYLESIAPLNNVRRMKKPLLIVHGTLDSRVPVSESEQMIAAARKEGLEVWSLIIKNEGHGFAASQTRDYVFLSEAVFVQQYLLVQLASRQLVV